MSKLRWDSTLGFPGEGPKTSARTAGLKRGAHESEHTKALHAEERVRFAFQQLADAAGFAEDASAVVTVVESAAAMLTPAAPELRPRGSNSSSLGATPARRFRFAESDASFGDAGASISESLRSHAAAHTDAAPASPTSSQRDAPPFLTNFPHLFPGSRTRTKNRQERECGVCRATIRGAGSTRVTPTRADVLTVHKQI